MQKWQLHKKPLIKGGLCAKPRRADGEAVIGTFSRLHLYYTPSLRLFRPPVILDGEKGPILAIPGRGTGPPFPGRGQVHRSGQRRPRSSSWCMWAEQKKGADFRWSPCLRSPPAYPAGESGPWRSTSSSISAWSTWR